MAEKKTQMFDEKEENLNERQYQRLINARNFHYEQFIKWQGYFVLFIGALFIAYYTLVTADNRSSIPNFDMLQYAILLIGYVISLLSFLSAKGYYYWVVNWIRLIHRYEKMAFGEPTDESYNHVYSLFYDKYGSNKPQCICHGSNISTPKVTLLIDFLVTIGWGTILLYILLRDTGFTCCSNCPCNHSAWLVVIGAVSSILITYILQIVLHFSLGSYLKPLTNIEER